MSSTFTSLKSPTKQVELFHKYWALLFYTSSSIGVLNSQTTDWHIMCFSSSFSSTWCAFHFTSLVNFILFNTIVNGIIFFISDGLLLVYRNNRFLNVNFVNYNFTEYISYSIFLVEQLGFSIYSIIICKILSFTSYFPI